MYRMDGPRAQHHGHDGAGGGGGADGGGGHGEGGGAVDDQGGDGELRYINTHTHTLYIHTFIYLCRRGVRQVTLTARAAAP